PRWSATDPPTNSARFFAASEGDSFATSSSTVVVAPSFGPSTGRSSNRLRTEYGPLEHAARQSTGITKAARRQACPPIPFSYIEAKRAKSTKPPERTLHLEDAVLVYPVSWLNVV